MSSVIGAQPIPLDWRDEAAVEMYVEAANPLVAAHSKLARALERQAEKMEQYFNTPYTEEQARAMEVSTRALVVIGDELRKWHELMYPNRPKQPDLYQR